MFKSQIGGLALNLRKWLKMVIRIPSFIVFHLYVFVSLRIHHVIHITLAQGTSRPSSFEVLQKAYTILFARVRLLCSRLPFPIREVTPSTENWGLLREPSKRDLRGQQRSLVLGRDLNSRDESERR